MHARLLSGIGESNPAASLIRRKRSTGPSCPVRTDGVEPSPAAYKTARHDRCPMRTPPRLVKDRRGGVRRGIEPLCPGHSRPCLPRLPHGRSPGNRTQRVLVPSQAAHLAPRLRWRKALESNQSVVSATRLAVERRDLPDFAFQFLAVLCCCSAPCLRRAQGRGRTGTPLRTQFLRLVCIPIPPPERKVSECERRESNPHHQFGRLGSLPLDDTRKKWASGARGRRMTPPSDYRSDALWAITPGERPTGKVSARRSLPKPRGRLPNGRVRRLENV